MIRDLVQLARPSHWVKNLFVVPPIMFSMRLADGAAWRQVAETCLAFCFAASATYVLNDLADRESDRTHPIKKLRPLPSGRVSPTAAGAEAALFLAGAVVTAFGVNYLVGLIILAYIGLQLAYTHYLKHKMLVDVMCIALGFVLRAAAGAAAIPVEISPWLILCTFTVCLFMGFCKRRNEATTIGDAALAREHRRTLSGYTPELLTHLITLSAGVAIVTYLLYASSPITVERFGTIYLVYTLPIVIYAICRFAMLSMKGAYMDPTDLILRDRPFQISAAAWAGVSLLILFKGRTLDAWVRTLF